MEAARLPQQEFDFRGGQRPAEVEPLHLVAAMAPKIAELPFGLDALGDNLEVEVMAEGDDGLGDRRTAWVVGHLADKGDVHFQFVEGKPLEVAEAGIAGAEIVDGKVHPQPLQVVQHGGGTLHVPHDHALDDLQFQVARLKAAVPQNIRDSLVQARKPELPG
ncbi:MAG: hypothetical protein ACD_75C00256G0002 [uncultured bacterium]|nr:MAG: hypothetical protein ACD_75C00256G0002 [uncultured bacterium]